MSITHLMDPSWTVDDLSIRVTHPEQEVNILVRDLLTLEILWEGETTNGVISFTDKYNLLEKMLERGKIRISWTSQIRSDNPSFTEHTFSITNIKLQEGDEPTVEIHFSDEELSGLDNIYSTENYKDKKPQEIISEYCKKLNIKTEVIPPRSETKMNMFIPSHRSSRTVLGGVLQEHGYVMVKDKYSSHIVHRDHLDTEKLRHTGETFLYRPTELYRRDQVIEYCLPSGLNINKLNNSIPSEDSSLNYRQTHSNEPDHKNVLHTPVGAKDKSVVWSGIKQSQNSGYSQTKEQSQEINNVQEMRIWVPGWNGNRLHQKITVEMPKPKYSDQNTKEVTISGEWVVQKVRDKIISTYFVQELFLRRAG